jgi:hypothetical protein
MPFEIMHGKITQFLEQIEPHYRGLGLPVLYGVLSVMAHKSVFYVADRGKGKTRVIKLIPRLSNTQVTNWDSFTLEGLSQSIGVAENQHLVWKVEEFSTLSDYHRNLFLTVCSKVASDGTYVHRTKKLDISIENCKLTMLIAIQPRLYSFLCNRYTQWESMSYDRFSKFLLLNPLRVDTKDASLDLNIPSDFVPIKDVSLGDVDLRKIVKVYEGQVSEGRAFLYARDYVKSLTGFLGEDDVKQEHAGLFYDLFHPYLDSFSTLQFAKDLESSVEVSSGEMKLFSEIGSYNGGVRKDVLAKKLYVTPRDIEIYAERLMKRGLINKSTHRGQKGKTTKYSLAPPLENFFKRYQTFDFRC